MGLSIPAASTLKTGWIISGLIALFFQLLRTSGALMPIQIHTLPIMRGQTVFGLQMATLRSAILAYRQLPSRWVL